jgi:hypothetical protein
MSIHTTVTVNARDHRTEDRRVEQRPVVDHRPVETRRPTERGHGPVVIDRRPIVVDHRPVIVTPAPVVVTTYDPGYRIDPGYIYRPAPLQVAGATCLDQGSLAIDTGGELTGMTTLSIQAAGGGQTYVTQVVLYDAAGNYQVVNLNTMISAQNPSVQVALGNGGAITRVVVDGHSDWGGAIALTAT